MNWAPTTSQEEIQKNKKAAEFLKELGIPIIDYDGDFHCVMASSLYDILNDEEKLRKLISILKLKAFW